MITTYNKPPYFDDYQIADQNADDKTAFDKNYLRILFQPNYAVQTRELNQLQSILQNQIDQLGRSIYKPGTPVIDGISTFTDNIKTVDLTISNFNVKTYFDLQKYIEVRDLDASTPGDTQTLSAEIIGFELLEDDVHRVWLRYTNGTDLYNEFPIGSEVFLRNDEFNLPDGTVDTINGETQIGAVIGTGIGFSLHVDEGVFLINGCFVHTPNQTKYLVKTNKDEFVSGNIVFRTEEIIVDSTDDPTLLDNANGTYNYAAPGADRYTIDLELALQTDDPELNALNPTGVYETSIEEEGVGFVSLLKIANSKVLTAARTEYSQLDRVMAERTFEESGNYTIQPFLVRAREFVNDLNGNDGAYTITQIESNDLYGFYTQAQAEGISTAEFCDRYFILEIEPSTAYVEGYRFELNEKQSIPVLKGRNNSELEGIYTTLARGNYVDVAWEKASGGNVSQPIESLFSFGENDFGRSIKAIKFLNDDDTYIYFRIFVYNEFDNSTELNFFDGFSYNIVAGTTDVEDRSIRNPGENKSIYKLPYSGVKGFAAPGGIEYTKQKLYTGESQGSLTYRFFDSTYSAYERFTSTATSDYVIFNQSTTTFHSSVDVINQVVPGPGGAWVDITFNGGQGILDGNAIKAIIPVTIEDTTGSGLRGNKSIASHSESLAGTKITLSQQDVITSSIRVTIGGNDVNYSVLYDGQGTNFVESPIIVVPTGDIYDISYDYFIHTNSGAGYEGDYFSADSYASSGVNYTDLPLYEGRRITDYIDFRKKRASDGTITGNPVKVMPNSSSEVALDYYLPRYDRIVVNGIDGEVKVVSGTPGITPKIADVPSGTMAIYNMLVPGYTFNVKDIKFEYIDNKRYTMRNIGELEKRIANLEYYTTLSILEKETKDAKILDVRPGTEGIERFKNGFLVDSFTGHSIGHAKNPDYICSIDPKKGILRPYFKQENWRFRYLVPGNPTAGQQGGTQVNLWEGEKEELFSNLKATITLSVQPFEVTFWEGSLKLSPSTDDWMDTVNLPTRSVTIGEQTAEAINFIAQENGILGTKWDSWVTNWSSSSTSSSTTSSDPHSVFNPDRGFNMQLNTRTTTTTTVRDQTRTGTNTTVGLEAQTIDLGERVVDTSIIPFMRSRDVGFQAKGLLPLTKVYAFFDGVDVTQYCIQQSTFQEFGKIDGPVQTFENQGPPSGGGTLTTDSNGEINGVFRIPNNDEIRFRTGLREFILTNSPTNSETERDTYSKAVFTASGLVQTKERVEVTEISPVFTQDRVEQNRTIVDVSNRTNSWYTDPVAQTFSVGSEHPDGVFISDVDLFFATKSTNTTIGVEVYIVTVENGIPTRNAIPGSRVRKSNSEVIASGRETNTITPTNFQFDYPLYLKSGYEYALVVFSPSPEYRVWVSELGGMDIITNTPVIKNPSFGVLLKSQNASTWTPDQLKDLTMVMNKAVFPVNQIKEFEFSTLFSGGRNQNIDDFDLALFNYTIDTLKFAQTPVTYDVEFLDSSSNSLIASGTYAGTKPKENYQIRNQLPANSLNEIKATVYMSTSNRDLSPVINLERCSIIGIENTINNDSTGENGATGGNAIARYITKPIELNNSADEIRVLMAVNLPSVVSNIEVYGKRKPSANSSVAIADIPWEKMPLLSVDGDQSATSIPSDDDENNFYEVEYILPNPDPTYIPPGETEPVDPYEFSEFTVKVVMLSSDTTKVPKIKDFRATATL